jgi:hypothetical protein
MTTDERTVDLIPLATAATFAQVSVQTIRRLIKTKALTRYEGIAPHGGSPPVLVSKRELQTHLIAKSTAPPQRTFAPTAAVDQATTTDRQTAPNAVAHGSTDQPNEQVIAIFTERITALEERLRLSTQLAAATAERDAAISRSRWLETELDHARRDRDDWRDRYDAVAAEMGALRARDGGAWWRRLLPAR